MAVIVVSPGVLPKQIEFPAVLPEVKDGQPVKKDGKTVMREFKRSCEGSLHVRPSATLEVTDDELEFMKADGSLRFTVVPTPPKAPAKSPKQAPTATTVEVPKKDK